jgi:phosphosulfolactate phosphohydrolase-like enzyme
MLATTTLVSAVARGRRALVASGPREARSLAASYAPALLAGDVSAGAGVPDSPTALETKPGDRRPLVLHSPPGTELIANAAGEATVLVACLRNITATVRHLEHGFENVAILAAGCRQEFSCEDQMAAAWIAQGLAERGFQAEDRRTADLIRRWRDIEPSLAGLGNSAARLRRAGRGPDVDFVLGRVDDVPLACAFAEGEVRAVRKRPPAATLPLPAGDLGVTRGPY